MASRQPRFEHDPAFPDEPEFGPIDNDDVSIFIPMPDAKKTALKFRFSDNGNPVALPEHDIEELVAKHGRPVRKVRELSRCISNCLHPEAFVCPVEIKRSVALERAKKRIEKAIESTRRGKVAESLKLIAPLSHQFGSEKSRSKILAKAKGLGAAETPDAKAYLAALVRLSKTPGAAFDLSPLDRRKIWDDRRKLISWECCRAWEECGFKVTYRPGDDGSVGGPLIDFIRDVIGRLTTMGVTPSPETIRRDIDLFKNPDPTVYRGEDLETCASK